MTKKEMGFSLNNYIHLGLMLKQEKGRMKYY